VGVVTESLVKEKLYRRLERLEEEMIPAGPSTILNVVFIKPDGTQAPGGFQMVIPSYGAAESGNRRGTRRAWSPSCYR
jgi:hypothetical protein